MQLMFADSILHIKSKQLRLKMPSAPLGKSNYLRSMKEMIRKDIKITISRILWEKAFKKAKSEFEFIAVHSKTDFLNIILLLGLYKSNAKERADNHYMAISIEDMQSDTQITFTTEVIKELLDAFKNKHSNMSYSELIENALADYIVLPTDFYTNKISPVYTIVGSKNSTMQKATISVVESMKLNHVQMTLVDACCATGSLYFGLNNYNWKSIILNDLNPLRTNMLNAIKQNPLKLIKSIMSTPVFTNQGELSDYMKSAQAYTKEYEAKRTHYHKMDCNIEIATATFIIQCISKQYPEDADCILNRIARIIPASIKLQNAIITQEDCLKYLDDDENKLVLLDVPYIGSEYTCSVDGYNYSKFHKKIANKLLNADYPFLYYCRSTPPKANNPHNKQDATYIQKMKLATHFFNKGFYFEKIYLKEDTELIISNRQYSDNQFQWTNAEQTII